MGNEPDSTFGILPEATVKMLSCSSIKVAQESKKWFNVVANLDFNLVAFARSLCQRYPAVPTQNETLGRFVSLASGLV